MKIGSANLRGLGLLLHELTGGFRNFHVLELGERLGDGREGFLDAVQHGIGFGGHWGLSILRFELWAHPVRIGPGQECCDTVNGASQHQCCSATSRNSEERKYPANCLRNRLVKVPNYCSTAPGSP